MTADTRRRAEELFNVYETAFPDATLQREWKSITMREREQWLAVGDAIAQAVREKLEQHDGRDDGHSFCSGCWEALRREETT